MSQKSQFILLRSVDAAVEIEIGDLNDNAPVFEETQMVVRLFQDVRLRTVVANVKVGTASVFFVMLMLTHSKDLLACSASSLVDPLKRCC